MTRPRSVTVIALLAIAEGIFALLVGLLWLQLGSIFDQEGGGMSSIIVMIAELKGWSLVVLSFLYFLFAVGARKTRLWAWWIGLLAPVLTLLYLVIVLARGGGAAALALFGSIVPVIMIWYLLTPEARQAFGRLG